MKTKIFLILTIVMFILSLSACTTQSNTQENITGDTVATVSEDGYQDITLSYGKSGRFYNYILTPSTVQTGIPVRVTGDISTLNGCYRTVVIQEYDIREYLSDFDNTFEFTPQETGDFVVSCSMGMATTTLHVI